MLLPKNPWPPKSASFTVSQIKRQLPNFSASKYFKTIIIVVVVISELH